MEKVSRVATVQYDKELDEYFIEFGEDLIEGLGWEIGDTLQWKQRSDGSFVIQKVREGESK